MKDFKKYFLWTLMFIIIAFAVVSGIVLAQKNNIKITEYHFVVLGVGLAVLYIASVFYKQYQHNVKVEYLKKFGTKILATVTEVKTTEEGNMGEFFQIFAKSQQPPLHELTVLKSNTLKLATMKKLKPGDEVEILIDSNDPDKYWFTIEGY